MSLSSIIRSTEPECRSIREIIRTTAPLKKSFNTYSGLPAFSKYPIINEYHLESSFQSSIVGTAFDILTKIICSYYTNNKFNTDDLMQFWIARYLDENEDVQQLYYDAQNLVDDVINSKLITEMSLSDDLISSIWLFAKLEVLWRSGFIRSVEKNDVISSPSAIVSEDLIAMGQSFIENFIDTGLVRSNSLITYSPYFSADIELKLGGIDADICIDNTLYDIKSTKKLGFRIQESIQLTAYYLFYLLDRLMSIDIDTVPLQRHEIKRIAFYKSRYGQIEYFNVEDIPLNILIDALIELNSTFELGITESKIKKVGDYK
ncbi:hypothetical protein [Acinetobacter ursingii]|uniref:hypothetical protein n=1 Tax=Acinetobacter ursingii TaxID=108980 RepID=UPI003AF67005